MRDLSNRHMYKLPTCATAETCEMRDRCETDESASVFRRGGWEAEGTII